MASSVIHEAGRIGLLVCELAMYTLLYVDKAGAPGQPTVDKITANSVDLSWKKPRDDGGALDKYVIEAKTPSGEWQPVCEAPAT